MLEITQSLLGGEFVAMDCTFICTLMVFCIVLEGISVIIGHIVSLGR